MPYVIGIDAMTQIEVSSLFSLTSKQEGKDGKDRPWRWYDSSDHGRFDCEGFFNGQRGTKAGLKNKKGVWKRFINLRGVGELNEPQTILASIR